MSTKTKIGIVGCGNISTIYLKNCALFENTEIVAVADLDMSRAEAQAEKFNVPRALTVEKILADSEVEIIINLTVPKAHGEVALQALRHGKSAYNEKPLALQRQEAGEMLALAEKNGLRVGCAPDTFLGGGLQLCRKLIDAGAIGTPVAAVAFMQSRGVEHWHPNPFFFYQPGGGPMFDMGPYYLTALTTLLGPVRRVSGSTRISYKQRSITAPPSLKGQVIDVEIPTHIAGIMDFAAGPVATIITSFDVMAMHTLPRIEIYGSEGSMKVPDPNGFDGPVYVNRSGEKEWEEVPIDFGYRENARGIGLADMAAAIRSGRPHRASGRLAYHVLDVMHAFHDSSALGRHIEVSSSMDRPDPMPEALAFGQVPA